MKQGKFDKTKVEEKREEERKRDELDRIGQDDRRREEATRQRQTRILRRSGHGQGQAQDTLPDSSIFTKPVHGCISNKANV